MAACLKWGKVSEHKVGARSKRKKILVGVIGVLAVVVIAAIVFASNYLLEYAIGRSGDGGDRNVAETVVTENETESRIESNREAQDKASATFTSQVTPEVITLNAEDGVSLAGFVFKPEAAAAASSGGEDESASATTTSGEVASNAGESTSSTSSASTTSSENHRWALVIHGYRGSHESATALAMTQRYYDEGFNVLAPDLRASGESGGSYVGMGWLDRNDVLQWIDWIVSQDANAQIVVHGISMGAATTMMVSGEQTPSNVVAFVEDCGYTSVWDVFSSELSLRFGLPEFPLLYVASGLSSAKAGYSFQEASALEAVARCEKPMLFIHGTADDFIPYSMMGELYNAKAQGEKQQLVSEGAGHAEAMYEMPETYWETVFTFVNEYMGA
jgi:hypothetical protein